MHREQATAYIAFWDPTRKM